MKKSILYIFVVILFSIFALFLSHQIFSSHRVDHSDFFNYYHVGQVINSGHSELVYNDKAFTYSVPVAYFFGLFALLPYSFSKTLFLLINCIIYFASILMIARFNKMSGRWMGYLLVFSSLWMPFLQDMGLANVDCLILFLVTLSALFAEKERPFFSGLLLGIATLFKLFPIAFAMVMGLKNWRIFVACILTIAASFIIPGSSNWLSANGLGIAINWQSGFTLPYLFLSHIDIIYFIVYVGIIAGITAWISYRSRKEINYFLLAAFSIPSVFLIMHMLEYRHLTILIFSIAYLLTSSHKNKKVSVVIIVSSVMISSFLLLAEIILLPTMNSSPFLHSAMNLFRIAIPFSLLALWLALAISLLLE